MRGRVGPSGGHPAIPLPRVLSTPSPPLVPLPTPTSSTRPCAFLFASLNTYLPGQSQAGSESAAGPRALRGGPGLPSWGSNRDTHSLLLGTARPRIRRPQDPRRLPSCLTVTPTGLVPRSKPDPGRGPGPPVPIPAGRAWGRPAQAWQVGTAAQSHSGREAWATLPGRRGAAADSAAESPRPVQDIGEVGGHSVTLPWSYPRPG